MTDSPPPPSLWIRAVADEAFREALIVDPLRALATFGDIDLSTDQVRALEALDEDERRALVTRIVREAHLRGATARFGGIGPDGRLGGG